MLNVSRSGPIEGAGSEPRISFGWLRTWSIGRREGDGAQIGVVEVNAFIPEHQVRGALDSLVGEFRSVRNYRCRFRGDVTNPNLDLISKDLRAALERLGHAVGRPSDGSRGVRWIEGSGDIAVDEATVRALAPHVRTDGFVQVSSDGETWFWTFADGTPHRAEGRHPLAVMDSTGTPMGGSRPAPAVRRSA